MYQDYERFPPFFVILLCNLQIFFVCNTFIEKKRKENITGRRASVATTWGSEGQWCRARGPGSGLGRLMQQFLEWRYKKEKSLAG